ncbi:MAG: type II CAAX endopeptidase family protein [Marmoricola sp.]
MSWPPGTLPPGPPVGPTPYDAPPPVAAPAYPYAEPHAYPQLLRTPTWAWWRAVVGALLIGVGVFVVAPVVLLPFLAFAVFVQSQIEHVPFADSFSRSTSLDQVTPASLLWLNLTLACGTLIAFALMRWLHHLRPRWLTSVRPGLRWKFFFVCLGLSVVALAAQIVVAAFIPFGDTGQNIGGPVHHLGAKELALALVILVSTPLQAIGEEYAFRGYLMQAFGSLFNTWTALVVTSVLFALAHGIQNAPLFFDRLAFGLLAGYLVIRIGGLEAGIALHVLNNYVAFGFALLFSDIGSALTVSEVSWWNLPLTITQNGVYLVLVLLVARRMGLTNRTAPPPGETPPTPTGEPGLSIGDARA